MSNLIPFDSKSLPAYLMASTSNANDELGSSGGGFKSLTYKGKEWGVKHSGEVTPIMKDGETARSIDVVIMRVWPLAKDDAKVYYVGKYVEGSQDKPTCYSNDGIKPSEYAADPQSKSCATCAHNQWGSRITDDGKKAKVCQDSKRVAVAAPGQLDDPLLLRVPATSLPALRELGALAKARRTDYFKLLVRVGFEQGVAYPKLTFKPLGYLDQESVTEVEAMRESDIVAEICGITEYAQPMDDLPTVSAKVADDEPFESPKPAKAEKPKAEPKPKAESKAKAQLEDMIADLDAAPKAKVAVEATPVAVEAPANVVEIDDDADLADAIAGLDLDD